MTLGPELAAIEAELRSYALDPLGFVLRYYPWGEPGTALAEIAGPEDWAIDLMGELGESLRADPYRPFKEAVCSGKGITKSATIAQISQWAMATFPGCRGFVTANTEGQLTTKTWPEFTKWYNLLACRALFDLTETKFCVRDKEQARNWLYTRETWSEYNEEAAQGLHNQGKRIIAAFDESSKIAPSMWNATKGIENDKETQIIWLAFGNGTQSSGQFYDIFTKRGQYASWRVRSVDARGVRCTNKAAIATRLAEDSFGDEDHDNFRVWVRGLFPKSAVSQLIPVELIEEAARRRPVSHLSEPLVMACDCSRGGEDNNAMVRRRGRDAQSYPIFRFPSSLSGPDLAQRGAEIIQSDAQRGQPHAALMVDCTGGYGYSLFDGFQTLNYRPIRCIFSEKATKPGYANLRAQKYDELRKWLLEGGAIPNDPRLKEELAAQRAFINKRDQMQLVEKEDVKAEIGRSPDDADGLMMTFWVDVATPEQELARSRVGADVLPTRKAKIDYDPFDGAYSR